jgi:hypothetical protein
MTMELKGKITHVLPEQSGEGRNGTWRKKEYVIEMPGTYPKSVCFEVWGNNIDAFSIQQGDEVTASIDLESREYNGRWYTNVKVWKISKETSNAASPPAPANGDSSWPSPDDDVSSSTEEFDDLPF